MSAQPLIDHVFEPGSITRIQSDIEVADVWSNLGQRDRAIERLSPYLDDHAHLDEVWFGRIEAQMAFIHDAAGELADARRWGERARERLEREGYTGSELEGVRELLARGSDPS